MRILLLAQFFPPDIGGEERHVLNLANALAGRGHDVAVATQHMDGILDYEVLDSGVRVHRFSTAAMRLPGVYSTGRSHHPPLPDPLGVRELARITRLERPDVVHAHNWIVNSAVALRRSAPNKSGFGLVLTLHDFSHVCATKRLMRAGAICEGPSVSRCLPCSTAHYGPAVGPLTAAATTLMRPWKDRAIDHLVCVSSAVAKGNRIKAGAGTSVIPNFIPDEVALWRAGSSAPAASADAQPDMPDDDFIFFAGDLSADKGVLALLRAYDALDGRRPKLLLVGRRMPDTPERLPDGAKICGPWAHDHVLTAFRRCQMAVLPSIWPDPCPTTVLEAMASGRPVISTATGGILDMIVDGESGLLLPPGDEQALTKAMDSLKDDAELRERLADGAQERVLQFASSSVVQRLEAIYERVARRDERPFQEKSTTDSEGREANIS
jgi:glycosyltransferase involved in cell wall biosynthesis